MKKNSVCVGQVFLKLVHESHVENLYLVKSPGKGFQLTLVCLAPVAKTFEFKASFLEFLIYIVEYMIHVCQ